MKTSTKRMLIVLGIALGLVLIVGVALRVMMSKGLMFVRMDWCAWLELLPFLILAGWGVYALYKKIQRKLLAKLTALLLIIVMLTLIAVASTFISLTVVSKFGDLRSQTGHELTILQSYYFNDGEDTERPAGEYIVYDAYPKKYGFFVDLNAKSEGQVLKGVESGARLMVVWTESNTARLYLEDMEKTDSGEIIVRFPD